jgi:hypothetical protein
MLGKPQMSTSTQSTIRIKPSVMEVIYLDAVPGLFFCKPGAEIG